VQGKNTLFCLKRNDARSITLKSIKSSRSISKGITQAKKSSLGGGHVLLLILVLSGNNLGLGVVVIILRLLDLDEVWHDLLLVSDLNSGTLHDLDLETENTLTELDGTDSLIDEIVLGLTSRDLITLSILLGLGSLTTDLTSDDNFATNSLTTAHNSSKDVVGSHTDGSTVEKLELEGLDVGSSTKVLVIGDWLDGKINSVVVIVEVVSLLDEGLDLLNLTGLLVEELVALGSTNTDLGVDAGGADLDTGITLHTESLLEELVELSLEDTVGNELLLGIDLFNTSFSHRVLVFV